MIYMDNAATTLTKPPQVLEAVGRAMGTLGNASRGTHDNALTASRLIYDTRVKLAGFFGCPRADHVVFTSNATEALNIALFGTLGEGDHVISTDWEHNSVLRPLYALEAERGVELSFVPANKQGQLDYTAFTDLLRPNTRAIVCTHASNVTGDVLDLGRLGKIARAHDLLLIVDAAQTAGALPLHMADMGIDILCFTGHKSLFAPQGTGGLCIRPGVEIRPWKRGGSGVHSFDHEQPGDYPTRLEAGTLNSHGIAGLSAALDFINELGLDAIHQHEMELLLRFCKALSAFPATKLYGDLSTDMTGESLPDRVAIAALNIADVDSARVSDLLSEDYGIATRPGAHCAPRMHQALGTTEQGVVRFSFSYFNTVEEIDRALEALSQLAD